MNNIINQLIGQLPVITGNRYSDLMSSAAAHERAAFMLIGFMPGAAENHAKAAIADRESAKAEITGGVIDGLAPDMRQYFAVATAPDGTQFTRETNDIFTHAVLCRDNKGTYWVFGFYGSIERVTNAKNSLGSSYGVVVPVVMSDRNPSIPTPEPSKPVPKKSGKRYAVATAPDGSKVVRQTERTYTHCTLWQRPNGTWAARNYFGSAALLQKVTSKYPHITVATVEMMDKKPKG